MASTPETSDFTSIKTRIETAKEGCISDTLARFQGDERVDKTDGIPFSLKDYIELVDATGRAVREDKRGHIDNNFPPILKRLNIDTETWLFIATTFEESFGPWIGAAPQLQQVCENHEKRWICRSEGCEKLYPT